MCTSGSFVDGQDGNEAIKHRLRSETRCPAVTTTGEAVVDAMKALEIRRVAMLTPYDEDVTGREIDFLASHGIAVTNYACLDIEDNLERGSITPEETFRNALKLDLGDADGIFSSCANVRVVEAIDPLESHTGKPVVTSSQATTWKALRLAGVTESISGYGALLRDR
jgi:maleate cis-trans isomerase